MLLRKPLSLWIYVSLFVASATMIPLANWLRCRPTDPERTLSELKVRLSQCTPPLYVVPQSPHFPESAMWVCNMPRSREQLCGLICHAKRVERGQWEGIVLCQMRGEVAVIEDDFIHDQWGKYGMRIGQLVFFGDPDLLRRIHKEIEG
jgi:hypothetical protein